MLKAKTAQIETHYSLLLILYMKIALLFYLFITNSSKWFAIIFFIFWSFRNFINITPHLHKLFQLHLNESGKNQPLKYE